MKKSAKKNNTADNGIIVEIKEELKRHTGVLLEEMSHNIKTIAEGHSILDSKINGIDNRLNNLESNSVKMEMNIESINSKMGSIENKVGTIDVKVDRIERELETVKHAVLDVGKITKDHEARITKIEEKVHV